ncbi:RelE/StbE family addiction module toxin [Clostridium sartagoforme AAU1]|uniref:RelE/StbE family addiction module toxin n=1 Tax=Clostridium sartagoforme AAU1 TaxID=1202534 RepID=R9C765_9CLOT|nr:type II toxin-antitoxin system RelE/ParE family toxin [Clostridium sartagoforme]EOR25209.1 RelE/StbE family addiction module toxin [Clostridium sartagoforme AAU1]
MKYKIVLTKQADTDLRGIYEYIAFTLLEPEIAARQLEKIEKGILSLDEMPERFRVFEKEPWYSKGLRQMSVDNFVVFYISNTEDKTVNVIRIMYGRRDIDKRINQ